MLTLTKYFFITFSSLYCFPKLLNLKLSKFNYLIFISASILTSSLISIIKATAFIPQAFLVVFSSLVFSLISFKLPFVKTFYVSLIASAVSYILSTLTLFILFMPTALILPNLSKDWEFDLLTFVTMLLSGIIEIFLIYLIFKIKRIKNGIPLLIKLKENDSNLYIALCTILIISISTANAENDIIIAIAMFGITLLGITFYFLWKTAITQKYKSKLTQDEIISLKNELKTMEEYIANIKKDNENLAKIIHKDNKIIPIMQMALNEMAKEYSHSNKINDLLNEISELSKSRYQAVSNFSTSNLPYTNITSLDALLKYIENRAFNYDISFNATIISDIHNAFTHISISDFTTLLSEALENALISTKASKIKNIHIEISYNNFLSVSIYDSGDEFKKEVFDSLGKKRITTRENQGGSGYGLITIEEILKKYNASLLIEKLDNNTDYSKRIIISFDNLYTKTYF